MKRTYVKYLTAIWYGLTAFLIVTMLQLTLFRAPEAHAASNPQISITLPDGTTPVGHPGTKVHISGSGFPSGSLALYTTPVNDPNKCTDGDTNLLPFENNARVSVKGSGSFQFDSKWPANANTATTAYYLCAVDSNANGTLSTTNFTVAQAVTLTVTPQTAQPGTQITLTGANWLPVQVVSVGTNIPVNGGQSFLATTTTPDGQGNFTVTLTVPDDAPAGSYSIAANAPNEPTQFMQFKQDNAIMVGAGTATPTATTTPTATASPTTPPTATSGPTPTQQANGGGNTTDGGSNTGGGGAIAGGGSNLNVLMIGLAGLGLLLIIIGVIIWAASSSRSS